MRAPLRRSRPAHRAWIGLGANLGDAPATLLAARDALGALPQTQLRAASGLWRSAPVDADGPDFYNAVVEVLTDLCPSDLLKQLQKIEQAAGRQRPYRNAPRTLDLDVLFYDDLCSADPLLTLPHPRWRQRAFVLHPLAEIAPDKVAAADWAEVAGQRIARQPDASSAFIIMNSD